MESHTQPVITRIAPSPTGVLHIGTARTALFNYLYSQKYHGTFLLRIEDTDRSRSTREYEDNILHGLKELGFQHDTFIRQSERVDRHAAVLRTLVESEKAYVNEEPAKDDPARTVEVVRLRNPGKIITFTDEVRGEITFDTTELGDFVIARSLQDPLYHLAVVVDDNDMGVTHVIRGEDGISNTPRQILLQEALGFPRPTYAHLPLILAQDRSKMSKRKGNTSIQDYLDQGYLPAALINYLALLGWNPGTDKEVFSLNELVQAFSLENVQKAGAVFDVDKLKWFNREHRKKLPEDTQKDMLLEAVGDHPALHAVLEKSGHARVDMLERYATTGDLLEAVATHEYDFYQITPTLDATILPWKKDPDPEHTRVRLTHLKEVLGPVSTDSFVYETVQPIVWTYAEGEGKGEVLWPLRYALSGKARSPDPFVLMDALGKEATFARIDAAIAIL